MIGRHRRRKRTTTTADYDAMLIRMIRAYGKRIGEDPAAALADLRAIEAALADAVNSGIYAANKVSGKATINEMADMLGMSKQAIHKRVIAGEEVNRRMTPPPITMRTAQPREIGPA